MNIFYFERFNVFFSYNLSAIGIVSCILLYIYTKLQNDRSILRLRPHELRNVSQRNVFIRYKPIDIVTNWQRHLSSVSPDFILYTTVMPCSSWI